MKLFPNKTGVNDLGWPMNAFRLELGCGIGTFCVPIETIKISGFRLNPLRHTIMVAPRDFFQWYNSFFRRKNMDIHLVNQGGPDEKPHLSSPRGVAPKPHSEFTAIPPS